MKQHLRGLVRRAGFDLNRWPLPPDPNSLRANLGRALDHHPVDSVVDVGAHHGGFAKLVRQIGFAGSIHSFEPDPVNFEILADRFSTDSRWRGYNLALGATPGELELHVHSSSDFNSFREPSEYGRQQFMTLKQSSNRRVPVQRLDQSISPDGPLLLKSDTQGFDLEVLAGAAALLDRVSILVIELSVQPIYESTPNLLEMLAAVDELGFAPAGMSYVTLDGAKVIEYDGVFVRR
jgi:FkbM family methyltransferase